MRKLKLEDLIIEEDEHFTFINKPPFLSSLEDRNEQQNLLNLLKQKNPESQLCHRLDKETSGIIVAANHNDAYRFFSQALENREVKKIYHAVSDGLYQFDNLEADESIYIGSSKSRIERNGKPSLTLIQTIERYKKHTLLKCYPVTGRMHQIRVHLSHHQAPIASDGLYGGTVPYLSTLKKNFNRKQWVDENPMIKRIALHAYSLTFKDPHGKVKEVLAPYPKDFAVFIKQLEKYN